MQDSSEINKAMAGRRSEQHASGGEPRQEERPVEGEEATRMKTEGRDQSSAITNQNAKVTGAKVTGA